MRILVVDEEVPYPLNSGKRLRTYNLLKHMATRHELIFVCRQHEGIDQTDPHALEDIGIRTIVVPHPIRKKAGPGFYGALLANLFSKYPYSVSSHYSRQLIASIRRLVNGSPFDLIHCEWTPYAVNLKPFSIIPSVVVAHNVESVIWRRIFEVERNPLKKTYIYLQWKKMKQFEQSVFPLFTQTITVSNQDKATIISQWVSENRITVVENGVDVDYFTPTNIPENQHSLVFTGAMDWRPNVDCMLYFLDEIWPHVIQSFPFCSLTIVGRRPMKILQDRVTNTRSVRLTGTVDDVRPYIAKSSVFIAPLRVAGGSRLKILEALSMGKPVVSTSVGAEGLDLNPDKHLLIADDPKSFAAAIQILFKKPKMRQRMGSTGRTLVEKKYDWKCLATKLEQAWFAALSHKTATKNN